MPKFHSKTGPCQKSPLLGEKRSKAKPKLIRTAELVPSCINAGGIKANTTYINPSCQTKDSLGPFNSKGTFQTQPAALQALGHWRGCYYVCPPPQSCQTGGGGVLPKGNNSGLLYLKPTDCQSRLLRRRKPARDSLVDRHRLSQPGECVSLLASTAAAAAGAQRRGEETSPLHRAQ